MEQRKDNGPESGGLQCPAITYAGERCKRYILPGQDFCSQHDPRRADQRRRAAAKAGKVSPPIRESTEIREKILALVEEVRRGDITPPVAHAIAALGNTAISSLRLDLKIRELEDFERRLNDLEANLVENRL